MTPFIHTEFTPGDFEGFGRWRMEHYYSHQGYILKARTLNPPFVLREYDILSWEPETSKQWNGGHYDMHLSLREAVKIVDGLDYSLIDWEDDAQVKAFLENHAAEHAYFDQVLGI